MDGTEQNAALYERVRKWDPRLQVVGVGIFLALFVLVVGLWYVQIVSYDRYRARENRQSFRLVRIPAVRGLILDRHGHVLAENRPNYELEVYLEDLRPLFHQAYRNLRQAQGWRRLSRSERREVGRQARYLVISNITVAVSRVLGKSITVNPERFHRHYYNWPYRPLVLRENLTPEEIARFLEGGQPIPGVDIDLQPQRFYPHGPLTAHVVGYVIRDDLARGDSNMHFNYSLPTYIGAIGVEAELNDRLSGQPGMKRVTVTSLCYRAGEQIIQPAKPGQSVLLSIDLGVQKAAYEALQQVGRYTRGAVVVLDVHNGDVLALVSSPSYDPNEFVHGISQQRWTNWLNHPVFRPVFNRATQGAYPLGSVFKLVTAMACFRTGVLTPQIARSVSFQSLGYYPLGRRRIRDTAPPGWYDFRRALKRSCNTYFIHYGLQAGLKAIVEMGRAVGFGQKIGLPLRQESRGFFPTVKQARYRWSEGNLANVCIGQEIAVTPMQVAVMVTAIANGGKILHPRIVLETFPIHPQIGGKVQKFPVQEKGGLPVSKETLQIIREAMLADTTDPDGTAYWAFHRLNGESYLHRWQVGGKTGTAEVERPGGRKDKVTWFVGFGPYKDPKYVVVVMVEGGISGGRTCAPVARKIFQYLEQRDQEIRSSQFAMMANSF